MPTALQLRNLEPFRYMRYAKEAEYAGGLYIAGSGMDMPSNETIGLEPSDFKLTSLCHNYGEPRAYDVLRSRYKIHPRNIFLSAGSSDAYVLICAAILEPGDHVLVEVPGYEDFRRVPQLFSANWSPLPRREENGFIPDVAEFKKLLTPRTKLVFLADLHNPTMVKIPPQVLRDLIKAARDNGTWVLVSEVYLDHLAVGTHDETCFGYGDNVIAVKSRRPSTWLRSSALLRRPTRA